MKQNEKTSLLDMVQGGVKERIAIEFDKVIDNILNLNADPKKKRTITLKIEFVPDAERKTVGVVYHADSKLVPLNPIATALYLGADPDTGEVGAIEMTAQIPGQKNLIDDTEAGERKVIPFDPKQALAR